MNDDATMTIACGAAPGMRHWLLQVVPPLLMLGIFFATTNGTSLVFLAGFLLVPVLVSAISIVAKLIFFKKRKYHLVRPLLTLAVFGLILYLANLTYASALEQAIAAGRQIHEQCGRDSACPDNPAGWQARGGRVGRNDFGAWLKYNASYHAEDESFHIDLYRGPDTGDRISGGIGLPLDVAPRRED